VAPQPGAVGHHRSHQHRVLSQQAPTASWQLKVDLGRLLKFSETIAMTTLMPGMVLLSESLRQVVLLELTVPWETQLEEAFERERAK